MIEAPTETHVTLSPYHPIPAVVPFVFILHPSSLRKPGAGGKPNPVPPAVPGAAAMYLRRRLRDACSDPPGSDSGPGRPILPYLALLRMGFAEPPASPPALVGSYPTVSPLPACAPRGFGGRFAFCGTGPPPVLRTGRGGGRYPPSCPAEFGLSSPS